jgi:predicted RNase H-like HicB family nuclease
MGEQKFNILVEQDEDGVFVANVPSIPGCYSQGKSFEEVVNRIKEAITVCIESEERDVVPMKFIGL